MCVEAQKKANEVTFYASFWDQYPQPIPSSQHFWASIPKACLLSYSFCPSLLLLAHSWLFSYLSLYHWGLPSENSVSEAPLPTGFCFSLIRVIGTCGKVRPGGGGRPGYSQPHSHPNIPVSDFRVLLILWIEFFITFSTRQVPTLFRPSSNISGLSPHLTSYIGILYKYQVTRSEHLENTFSIALNVPMKLVPHQRY